MAMRLLAALVLVSPLSVAAAATPASQVAPTVPSTYRISPGDQIEIYVWGEERLQRALSVLPDGSFAFPLAGTIKASGKTPTEIESELSQLLAGQFKGVPPQVTVSVRQPAGMQVSVLGKVRSPGSFSPNRYVTVLEALAQSGGPTEFADVNNIVILRKNATGGDVIKLHLENVLRGRPSAGDLSVANIPQLIAGDTVVVP